MIGSRKMPISFFLPAANIYRMGFPERARSFHLCESEHSDRNSGAIQGDASSLPRPPCYAVLAFFFFAQRCFANSDKRFFVATLIGLRTTMRLRTREGDSLHRSCAGYYRVSETHVSTGRFNQTMDLRSILFHHAHPNTRHSQQLRIVLWTGRSDASQRPIAKDPECRNVSALCFAQAPGTQSLLDTNLRLRFGHACSCLPGPRSSCDPGRYRGLTGGLLSLVPGNRTRSILHDEAHRSGLIGGLPGCSKADGAVGNLLPLFFKHSIGKREEFSSRHRSQDLFEVVSTDLVPWIKLGVWNGHR